MFFPLGNGYELPTRNSEEPFFIFREKLVFLAVCGSFGTQKSKPETFRTLNK
jgi:hypothetical protein